jgi:hypothetical protein
LIKHLVARGSFHLDLPYLAVRKNFYPQQDFPLVSFLAGLLWIDRFWILGIPGVRPPYTSIS